MRSQRRGSLTVCFEDFLFRSVVGCHEFDRSVVFHVDHDGCAFNVFSFVNGKWVMAYNIFNVDGGAAPPRSVDLSFL